MNAPASQKEEIARVLRALTDAEHALADAMEAAVEVALLVHPPDPAERGMFSAADRRSSARRRCRAALSLLLCASQNLRDAHSAAFAVERAARGL